MTDTEYDVLVKAMKATVKRIAVENTWLRHSLMEMETRVAAMATQLTHLEGRVKEVRKSLRTATPSAPNGNMTERSKAAPAARTQSQRNRSNEQ